MKQKLTYKKWRKKVCKRICIFGGGPSFDGWAYAEEMMSHVEDFNCAEPIYNKGFNIAKSAQKIILEATCQRVSVKLFKK